MKKSGFTVLEIVVVVAILAIGLGLGLVYSQVSILRADLQAQTSSLVGYLRLAQSDAASGKGNSAYGIHLTLNDYTIFAGATYDEEDENNRTIELPSSITITNIDLTGGGDDIIFTPPRGTTATDGTFSVNSDSNGQTKVITVHPHGIIEY